MSTDREIRNLERLAAQGDERAAERLEQIRLKLAGKRHPLEDPQLAGAVIVIDGEEIEVDGLDTNGVGHTSYIARLDSDAGEFLIVRDEEAAHVEVTERYMEIARSDPATMRIYVGDEALIRWTLGHRDEYGRSNLREWIESLDPDCELGSYDNERLRVNAISPDLLDLFTSELGWTPTIAYRL